MVVTLKDILKVTSKVTSAPGQMVLGAKAKECGSNTVVAQMACREMAKAAVNSAVLVRLREVLAIAAKVRVDAASAATAGMAHPAEMTMIAHATVRRATRTS